MNTAKQIFSFLVVATLFTVGSASANLISIQRDFNLYGHLSNEGNSCCSTSTINSFMYLINKNPGRVDGLIPDLNGNGIRELSELHSARDKLRDGWLSPGGVFRSGMGTPTFPRGMWEQTAFWIDDFAPGVDFRLKGMEIFSPANTWYKGNHVTQAYPTWDFLWNEMLNGEDVEINIYGFGSIGHSLTLTSLKFDDLNNNQSWDSSELGWLDYLDPNNPTQLFERGLWHNADGSLGFNWFNGGANPPADVYIGLAYAEGIPEPGILTLLGIAFVSFIVGRKRRPETTGA